MSDFGSYTTLAELIGVMGVTGAAVVSTNFDNLVIISAYSARPGYRPLLLRLTFLLVCLAVVIASLALARMADTLPADKIRYLGLIPLGIGLFQAVKLIFRTGSLEFFPEKSAPEISGAVAYLGFGLVLLANSSDSIAVLTPLLADLKPSLVLANFFAALIAAFGMGFLADALTRHAKLKIYLVAFAEWALPFLLIAIGLLIFTDNPRDLFVS